jgi:hypothetical protein
MVPTSGIAPCVHPDTLGVSLQRYTILRSLLDALVSKRQRQNDQVLLVTPASSEVMQQNP